MMRLIYPSLTVEVNVVNLKLENRDATKWI